MHKQHPQTAYRKYAILIGTIFENCDNKIALPHQIHLSLFSDLRFGAPPPLDFICKGTFRTGKRIKNCILEICRHSHTIVTD
jgi:hypothetical protein